MFLPGFVLGIFAGSFFFAWLFDVTGGSILAVVLWHGTFNFVTASKAGEGVLGMVASLVVAVAAVLIAVFYKPSGRRRPFAHMDEIGVFPPSHVSRPPE